MNREDINDINFDPTVRTADEFEANSLPADAPQEKKFGPREMACKRAIAEFRVGHPTEGIALVVPLVTYNELWIEQGGPITQVTAGGYCFMMVDGVEVIQRDECPDEYMYFMGKKQLELESRLRKVADIEARQKYVPHEAFLYHTPDDKGVKSIEQVRLGCSHLLDVLLANVPGSAERTLAIRKLEEVSMWANKSIVFEGRQYLPR